MTRDDARAFLDGVFTGALAKAQKDATYVYPEEAFAAIKSWIDNHPESLDAVISAPTDAGRPIAALDAIKIMANYTWLMEPYNIVQESVLAFIRQFP